MTTTTTAARIRARLTDTTNTALFKQDGTPRQSRAAKALRQKITDEATTAELKEAAERRADRAAARLKVAADRNAAHDTPLNFAPGASGEDILTAAEVAASVTLRTLHNQSGILLFQQLQLAFHADLLSRSAATIYSQWAEHRAAADEAAEVAARAYRAAARMLEADNPDEAAAALELWEESKAEADRNRRAAEGEAAGIANRTLSDRADLVQAAALAFVETWTTPATISAARYAAAGIDPATATPEQIAELQTAANFRYAVNAARRAASRLAHPDAACAWSTKKRPLLYFLPVVAGGIADRYGYRRVLFFAFTCLIASCRIQA